MANKKASLVFGLIVEGVGAVNLKHKALKTIQSDDKDIIDCIDIYKQPIFDDPSFKTLQMEPSSYPNGPNMTNANEIFQNWNKNGECPDKTVPIRRSNSTIHCKEKYVSPFMNITQRLDEYKSAHEYAIVRTLDGAYHGGHADLLTWGPKTEENEFSLSQIWIASKPGQDFNSIEAGWIVYPKRYGDHQTRFFIYWTANNYQSIGCYDMDCIGFVQTNKKIALGAAFPVSIYNGEQHSILINIFKDKVTGNWWLQLQGITLGYWPGTQLKNLANGANQIAWGGEVVNNKSAGHHTTTQMGNGHFAEEGVGKAGYFKNLKVVDGSNNVVVPAGLRKSMTNSTCYDVNLLTDSFFYGGVGFSPKCM
ncbi:uncharacterized protein LOC124944964 [Impatiens glandulifera]|uniref:uncharacterized protein LOC124944964 n=1 Tax=Impatiens glandulifera TaxID=253017 RepID=UPI001FB0FDBF|nr:uncharacterized protein LOC124944964 [Impatiens glandulifera]